MEGFLQTVSEVVFWWKAIAIVVSVTAVTAIIAVVIKTQEIVRWRVLREITEFIRTEHFPREERKGRWENVEKRMQSNHPSDWKLAVIEADSIMDDLLKRMGYEGITMGDRLKQIEPSDFESLQAVWKAHKLRNRIAHEPETAVTKSEAEYTIDLFKKGLEEFEYI
ncbi:MAG: hypothetical protein COU47_02065 [Candidatus Niyogibacteria bacterium CG10_big_fil_rev_8_21_14_0_10_46_36]|uniref:DUF4145 domain-containing protein n=1 Tax=Candidatus Niyogibacteria bacterium CG10_big_fil_rev_8_21_14_0_10_46_36 TaxID=1974726 RepID=A0A2H0TDM5_9BACT|nr:MAG: hypothetical protein COU47_02065 [Candidatus Niyogibacteria bacterium CG10_big_fil_rev_8_21_14_0_10_46_36]